MRLEVLGSPDAVSEEWDRLAELAGNPFATREWVSTWWRHFGAGREPLLVACHDESGRIVALLPLYRVQRGSLSVIRFMGRGASDVLGPIGSPDDGRVASAVPSLLDAERPDVFVADDVPAAKQPEGVVLRRTASPVVRTGGRTWEAFLAERSRNFRSQVGARERRLAREHELRFRTAEDADRLDAEFGLFLGLHQRRWASRSASFQGKMERFHRDFAHQALDRGWLRLRFLELDGRPAAALYNLRFGGSEWNYQAGRDPAFERGAVGFVLHARALREVFDDGLDAYRLLRGGETYKARFANADEPVVTVAQAGSLRGRAAVAVARAAFAAGRGPRRRASALLG